MTFLELANKRCSVRSFSPTMVEINKLNKMLFAVQLAPSAVKRQPWKVYVVIN